MSVNAAAGRKPNSVRIFALARERCGTIIPLVPTSLAGSSDLPGSLGRAVLTSAFAPCGAPADIASLFGLAPCGVLPAICLTADAVRSYRTFSPLPAVKPAVCFLWHFPLDTLSNASPRPLAGMPPCGDRTFLPRNRERSPIRQTIFSIALVNEWVKQHGRSFARRKGHRVMCYILGNPVV